MNKILNELGEVAEGIDTSYAIEKLADKNRIYTPIVNEVAAMLRGKDVQSSLKDLLNKK